MGEKTPVDGYGAVFSDYEFESVFSPKLFEDGWPLLAASGNRRFVPSSEAASLTTLSVFAKSTVTMV